MLKEIITKNIFEVYGRYSSKDYRELTGISSKEEFRDYQEFHLKKLLWHAYKKVPYYKNLENIGLVSDEEIELSKFHDLPILKKEDIRKNLEQLKSIDSLSRKSFYSSTGGSTGDPVKFIQDSAYLKWGFVIDYYYNKEILNLNKPFTAKKLMLWGSEKDLYNYTVSIRMKIINWLTSTIFLNSFQINDENLENYVETINSTKPDLIRGYASSLYQLSKYIADNNISVHRPKIIISAAENLMDYMRYQIEKSFGVKVYDFYGSREVTFLAGECESGLMHLLPSNFVEILDDNNEPVNEGEEGRVIVTTLFNYSMPLIRYEIGDMAVLGPQSCQCGNILPTIEKIIGRITEHFLLEDGTIIPPEFFIHMIGVVWNPDFVKQFQVIQKKFKEIEIIFVPKASISDHNVKEEQESINDKIRVVMGSDCCIVWTPVDEIPKTKSGKYIYTRSMVNK